MRFSKIRKNDSLKIIYHNIQSLGMEGKIDEIKMKILKERPDVMVFVETWLKPKTESAFKNAFPSYKAVFMSRKTIKQGGIAIFYRKNLTIRKLRLQHVNINHLMLIKLVPFNINLLAMYRTYDKGCGIKEYWKHLDVMLEENGLSKMIVLGDSNMDVLNKKNSQYMKRFTSKGFRMCNRIAPECYTRKNKRSCKNTIIDHVFTNMKTSVNVECIDVDFSDHRMLVINAEILPDCSAEMNHIIERS